MSEQEVEAVGVHCACEELGSETKKIRWQLEWEESQITWFVLFLRAGNPEHMRRE